MNNASKVFAELTADLNNMFDLTKRRPKTAFCDYIASLIQKNLSRADSEQDQILQDISSVNWDLTPDGTFLSTKKTILVTDAFGTKYKVTVEEV